MKTKTTSKIRPCDLVLIALIFSSAISPPARAENNLLPPVSSPASLPGDAVLPPWRTSDGRDQDQVSVKLGSPDGNSGDWIAFSDKSNTSTANLRCDLPSVSKGTFSFEILIAEDSRGVVMVALGNGHVINQEERKNPLLSNLIETFHTNLFFR